MRFLSKAMMGILLMSGAAQAAPTWKVDGTVYFAPDARLTVNYSKLEVSDTHWDRVQIEVGYPTEELRRQFQEQQALNPKGRVGRLSMASVGKFRLQIPSMGVDELREPMQTPEGPRYYWDFFVSQKDSRRVREALRDLNSFAKVEGKVSTWVPFEAVVEHIELPASICTELKGMGNDLYSIIMAYPKIASRVDTLTQREDMKDRLKAKMLNTCFDIRNASQIDSFAQLLALPVTTVNQEPIVEEIRKPAPEMKTMPLEHRIVLEE